MALSDVGGSVWHVGSDCGGLSGKVRLECWWWRSGGGACGVYGGFLCDGWVLVGCRGWSGSSVVCRCGGIFESKFCASAVWSWMSHDVPKTNLCGCVVFSVLGQVLVLDNLFGVEQSVRCCQKYIGIRGLVSRICRKVYGRVGNEKLC